MTISDGAHVNTNQNASVGATPQAIIETPPPTAGGSGDGLVTIKSNLLHDSVWRITGDCLVGQDEPGHVRLTGTLDLGNGAGGGILRVGGLLTVGPHGVIDGFGILAAHRAVNGGLISPGLSPGTITIEGDYEQPADGVLEIEVAGLEPGQFDVLHVTGNATLAGKVRLHFINGFVPQPGDNVDFVQVDGTITGVLTGEQTVVAGSGGASGGGTGTGGGTDTGGGGDGTGGGSGGGTGGGDNGGTGGDGGGGTGGNGGTGTGGNAQTFDVDVKWEVTPEGTCQFTVTDVRAISAPLPPQCGNGACGATSAPLVAMTILGMSFLRRRFR